MKERSGIRKEILKNIRSIVVKVGTGVLCGTDGLLSRKGIDRIVSDIAAVHRKGRQVVLVTSGAIGAGLGELGWSRRPTQMAKLQAAAAVGQCALMQEYVAAFKKEGLICAQVLLTNEDLKSRSRYLNIRKTLQTLLAQGVVPVVNENDTVSTQEIQFGDNDRLSALVTQLLGASLLILLSDVDGLLRRDEGGPVRVGLVESIDRDAEACVWEKSSALGTGGMKTKLLAARMVTRAGEAMVIANGRTPEILQKILQGDNIGTLFLPKTGKMAGKKRWIAHFVTPRGRLMLDDGACKALREGHKSLLPTGIRKIAGDFSDGDTVSVCGLDGEEFGRGIVRYASHDLSRILGKKTQEIFEVLGKKTPDEVIHRDNLVIL